MANEYLDDVNGSMNKDQNKEIGSIALDDFKTQHMNVTLHQPHGTVIET